jgi:hypothetical protein
MSAENLVEFLRTLATRADLIESLKVQSKDEVIAAAAAFGLPFTEAEFDSIVWDLEVQLAKRRGEPFDGHFPLWETMWGCYYLEYLVLDMVPSLRDSDVEAVLSVRPT